MGKLINIDNGGTLTDICVIDGSKVTHTKTLTTPYDLSKCFFEGLKKAARLIYGEERIVDLLLSTDHIRYSTTQGTNAIVERKGPRLGLIVCRGTDVALLKASHAEAQLFEALVGDRVASFDLSLSWEQFDGEVVATINRLTAAGANRIVISFEGEDYRQDEARFKQAALQKFPRHLLGVVPVLCASDLADDVSRTRRTWTTLLNAFLHPTMETFLYNAEGILREYYHQHPLLIFRNDGDSARVARTVAIKTYSSGPRGGMEGARALAAHYCFKRLLTMDIGGTTTDIGLVEDGRVKARPRGDVEGVAVSLPLCDVVSVGVGGSSIIKAAGRSMQVGPESTGGAPGPACFGLGGQNATITDVFLLTGLIDPVSYFGGAMKLDRDRAEAAIRDNIAGPLGLDLDAALEAAQKAWCHKVAGSLIEYTPIDADTTLAAFGGAGPFLVTDVAEAAGIGRAIIPGLAAVFSAFGIGFSDIAQSYQSRLPSLSREAADEAVEELAHRARRDMFAEGFDFDDCVLEWSIFRVRDDDEASLPWSPGTALPGDLRESDHASVALRIVKPINHAEFAPLAGDARIPAVSQGTREVKVAAHGLMTLPVYRIEEQPSGAYGEGPCILEEAYFTGRVGAGWRFEINANRDTLLTKSA
ncbi:hydantoinase/oxoprolinase family protein [Aromatoleum toluclasticum]|uniref:hydantoinase/oxoprolinase family protein n=1 Tax=Aromatoleum toluclasticum TaxID=92003 RepID=UPI00036CE14B|nr:hydantoinase/oxoprolinase family protein [Aromatoleum toluclasticum]